LIFLKVIVVGVEVFVGSNWELENKWRIVIFEEKP
jgi:hypothetical protein